MPASLVSLLLLGAIVASISQGPAVPAGAPSNLREELIVEQDAATPADDKNVAASHDKRPVAWAAKRAGDWVMVVNGEPLGPAFPQIESATFCGPGSKLVWAARRAKKWLLIVDGKDGGPEYDSVKAPVCSPDGQRIAYAAKRGAAWMMVVDGKPGPAFPTAFPNLTIMGAPLELKAATFSPDSRRVSYLGWALGAFGGTLDDALVVDGEIVHKYEVVYGPSFSADGLHLAFAAKRGKNDEVLFVDDKPGPVFENVIAEPALSPDGRHVALITWKDKKLIEVVDGKPQRELPAQRGTNFAYGLTFSPDGTRLAYVLGVGGVRFAVWGGKRARKRVILDGQQGKEYDSIGLGNLTFSAEGRHLAYAVHDFGQKKSVVVLDGQEGTLYDYVVPGSLSFSDDGSITYVARQGRRFVRVTQQAP